jgi:hypothetical protein
MFSATALGVELYDAAWFFLIACVGVVVRRRHRRPDAVNEGEAA